MTVEETKEAIKVMQAFVDGKEIEQRNGYGEYVIFNRPRWNWDNDPECYRVKPELHYRPFESAEEVMEAIKEHGPQGDWVRIGTTEDYARICRVHGNKIQLSSSPYSNTLEFVFGEITFADGTPFGKLVEE